MKKLVLILLAIATFVQAKALGVAQEPADTCDCAKEAALNWRQRAQSMGTPRILTTFSIKTALKLGLTPALKNWVAEERPDKSERNSFPSRHATWAYGIAGTITYQLGPSSPWWAVGSMAAANCVGFQRIIARRHYPHDIMGGMALGLSTDLMAKVITNWIFGRYDFFPCWNQCENIYMSNLSVSTGMAFPLTRTFGAYTLQNSLESTLRYSLPLTTHYGITASATMNSGYVEMPNTDLEPLSSVGVLAGAQAHWQIADGPFAISVFGEGGYRHNIASATLKGQVNSGALQLRAGMQSSVMLTHKLSLALETSYGYTTLSIGEQSRGVASISATILCIAYF